MILNEIRRYHPLPGLGICDLDSHKGITTTLPDGKILDGHNGPVCNIHVLYLGTETMPSSERYRQRTGSLRISWIVVALPSTNATLSTKRMPWE